MKTGTVVKVKDFEYENALWASMFIGRTGIVEGKCGLYKNCLSVRFTDDNDSLLASFKRSWLQVKG